MRGLIKMVLSAFLLSVFYFFEYFTCTVDRFFSSLH